MNPTWNDDIDDDFVLVGKCTSCTFCDTKLSTLQRHITDQEGLCCCDSCHSHRKDEWEETKHIVIKFAWEIAKALIRQKCGVVVQ